MVQKPYVDQNVDLRPSGLPTVQNPYVDQAAVYPCHSRLHIPDDHDMNY